MAGRLRGWGASSAVVLLSFGALAGAGCGSTDGSTAAPAGGPRAAEARARCTAALSGRATGGATGLVDAQAVTVERLNRWGRASADRTGTGGAAQFAGKDPGAPTDARAFCIYSGTFPVSQLAGTPEPTAASYVVDPAGGARFFAAGQPAGLKAASPAAYGLALDR
jgi:hypothetical protein